MLVKDIYKKTKEILGQCSQEVIFDRLTEVIEVMKAKGDWDPMIGYIDICGGTDKRTFALPDDIETPLAVNVCGRPTYMRNKWYEFHLNGMGSNHETSWTWDDAGFFPTIVDIIDPSILIAVADLKNDLSTIVRVFGADALNRQIRTQERDGSWQEGFIVPLNIMQDFPNGIITPNPNRPFYRIFTAKPVTQWDSSTPHGFQSGVSALLTLISVPLPSPLKDGSNYYIGVIGPNAIALYLQRSDAIAGVNPIQIQNFSPSTIIDLLDKRQVQTQTKFQSANALNFIEGSAVSFVGSPLPVPINAAEVFYLHLLDANDFTIHASEADAIAAVNPLFVTTPGASVTAKASQPITPYTKLVFTVDHNFLQNDAVTVANASGNLPTPLLPGTTYYVRYLSSKEITLHTTLADAAIGTNAIIITDAGAGVSSVVKLIPATANPGSVNNINAPNHNLDLAGGDFVQFQSSGALPTPLLSGTVYRAEPPDSQNSFTVASTDITYISTVSRRRSSNTALIETTSPHGFLTGDAVDVSGMGGSGYNHNQVIVTVVDPSAFTYANTGSNEGVVGTVSRRRANEISVIVTSAPHGLTTGQYANIQNLSGSNYNLPYAQVTVIDSVTFSYADIGINDVGFSTTTRARTSNVAQITTISPHGLSSGQKVTVQGMTDPTFNDNNATVTVVDATNFSYSNSGSNVSSTADTVGYVAIPQSDSGGAIARPITDTGGSLTSNRINLNDVGTGVLNVVISRAFTIGFYDNWFTNASNLTTGTPFTINSSGVIPVTNPTLSPVTTYYARVIDPFTIQFFETLAKAEDPTVRLTASYARASNVATIVTSAAHTLTTGDAVDINFMADATFNVQRVTITVINSTTFTFANSGANISTTADTAGQVTRAPIKIVALGNGETDLILQASVSAVLLSNLLEIDNFAYLADGTIYQFSTDGTLPSPLLAATNYEITIINGMAQISDDTGALVILTDIGSGNHFISRDFHFTVDIPGSVQVLNNEYNNGDAVIINNEGGVVPSPLTLNETYYIRRIDDESVEIYDTAAHAMASPSITGRITILNNGTGTNLFFQLLPAIQVQRVERVLITPQQSAAQASTPRITAAGIVPPLERNGFIDLYAWDYGRTNALAMVGHYAPKETQPLYRRIKILNSSAWIRMRYRRKTFKVTSLDDYIPLNSQLAILMMVRAVELYRTNFTDEGDKYEAKAVQWMNEEHASRQGPESISIQIDTGVFMNPEAEWMT